MKFSSYGQVFNDTLLVLIFLVSGCSPISYKTLYSVKEDPTFEFQQVETIGFVPMYWTSRAKEENVSELSEKQIYAYIKPELEKRGYKVYYIPAENFFEHNDSIIMKAGLAEYPDLTLTLGYRQTSGQIQVPAQSGGFLGWGKTGGQGSYGKTGSYSANVYDLLIGVSLWTGKPSYMQEVWSGQILKGSPSPDLFEKAEGMIQSLFYTKGFPKKKK